MAEDQDQDRLRLLPPPPPPGPRFQPNEQLAGFLERLAKKVRAGTVDHVVMLYRMEGGFGHFVSTPSESLALESLAIAGAMDYVKNSFVLSRVSSD